MKRSLFIILGALCFAIAGKAQGSDVSVQKKNTGYSFLNDTVEAVKDSMTFEQRVEMINRMKRKQDTKLLRYVAGITGGLCDANENSYMVELTFAYYPLIYAGVSCGIEWNDNYGDRPLMERYEDDEYDPKRVIKINLTPGLAFRTPTLWLSKRRTAGLMLHCEPGLCITPFYNDIVSFTEIKDAQGVGHPASYTDELYGNITIRTVSNHGGKWLAWRIKSALTFRSGDVFLSLGWLTSDFNIENGRNNIRYTKGKRYNGIEKYKHTNTLFASITGQF